MALIELAKELGWKDKDSLNGITSSLRRDLR